MEPDEISTALKTIGPEIPVVSQLALIWNDYPTAIGYQCAPFDDPLMGDLYLTTLVCTECLPLRALSEPFDASELNLVHILVEHRGGSFHFCRYLSAAVHRKHIDDACWLKSWEREGL